MLVESRKVSRSPEESDDSSHSPSRPTDIGDTPEGHSSSVRRAELTRVRSVEAYWAAVCSVEYKEAEDCKNKDKGKHPNEHGGEE